MHTLPQIRAQLWLTLLLILPLLSACLPPVEQKAGNTGELIISLTDAPGDFVHYAVDVQSITLTHANGSVVETVPQSTRVDFAQYVNIAEFFTAAQVPRGAYISASMLLDFSNADIQVEDEAGNAVAFTQIVDTDGNPIKQLRVDVQLEQGRLLIAPGIPALLALDFDLQASNEVIWNSINDAQIIVRPVLLADVNPQKAKIHRLRGPLLGVDVQQQQFELAIHPFQHREHNGNQRRFGHTQVNVDEQTIYDINGIRYQANDGLLAMQQLTSMTAIIVKGDLQRQPLGFLAREVYAGDSVPGGSLDVVTGNITARNGNTLQIRGATLVRAGGYVMFNDLVTANIATETRVNIQGALTAASIDDLSVGQRVQIFGVMNNDDTLDATQGHAIMHYTHLAATSVSSDAANQQLVVQLQAIDSRKTSLFDFSGTGKETTLDADANQYEVATNGLFLNGIAANTPVKIIGHINAFGQAPVDFTAHTITNVSQAKTIVSIAWQTGSNAMTTISDNLLTLSLADTTQLHHVIRLGVRTDLTTLGDNIHFHLEDNGLFVLNIDNQPRVFVHSSEFLQALAQHIESGKSPQRVIADGNFDDATQKLDTRQMSIKL